ncbi:aerobactin siderophore biosynthesis protein iucB [Purpureocillium lilacinum]|uniref:Aerobactin siderophore biosynthesis protein iucB n=1 Tax=Purpureocillium lilacinum TaxID=33203 RepID=A0A179FJ56_PURLI|nr:aerobactin siderophore biosynthesis protein iucB [Purpureocillium lilacinum]
MASETLYLPDGQTFNVSPVFAGVRFHSQAYNIYSHPFPAGWTVVLHTEDTVTTKQESKILDGDSNSAHETTALNISTTPKRCCGHSDGQENRSTSTRQFTRPTLDCDSLFISSFANPPSAEFKPASSPTRHIAMMLWVTLYWYFHQPDPTDMGQSRNTAVGKKPRCDWRVIIRRDGILRGRNIIPKLERMGLIAALDSSVGTCHGDASGGFARMFVSKRMFWQIPGRLFLFILEPIRGQTHYGNSSYSATPSTSRPSSPDRTGPLHEAGPMTPSSQSQNFLDPDSPGAKSTCAPLLVPPAFPVTAYYSTSYLPTYYPPAPLQYIFTDGTCHPLRPKPPHMGEIFYTRYVPSVGQYLSFRVASLSPLPVPYLGPVCTGSDYITPEERHLMTLSDTELLSSWHSKRRVCGEWADYGPQQLNVALRSQHSFPAIGMWGGVPFGYFEIYWVKEGKLRRTMSSSRNNTGDWDRGLHVMMGQEWAERDSSVLRVTG